MHTDSKNIPQIFSSLKKYFNTFQTRDLEWRKVQLKALKSFLKHERVGLKESSKKDLRQVDILFETADLGLVEKSIDFALSNIEKWAAPKAKLASLLVWPGRSFTVQEPLGVIAIFGVWNFPVLTLLNPLVGAIAAGNCAILKPSEIAANTSEFIQRKICKYLDREGFAVVTGGVEQASAVLELPLDHIFYTGGQRVGKIVMAAAAKNLTPVTLELGGKNPVIVSRRADVRLAAKRIVYGKLLNMGQACVAPDYVLVDREIADSFCAAAAEYLFKFLGDDPRVWKESKSLSRIINRNHHARLTELIKSEKKNILIGGKSDISDLFIQPTLVLTNWDSPLMQSEIFGPILPILKMDSLDEGLRNILQHGKPLALYFFSRDDCEVEKVLARTSSGSVCVNDTFIQAGCLELPFGGVGSSGMGKYYGRYTFALFSHEKAVLKRGPWLDFPLRYPPYNAMSLKVIKTISRMSFEKTNEVLILSFKVAVFMLIGFLFFSLGRNWD